MKRMFRMSGVAALVMAMTGLGGCVIADVEGVEAMFDSQSYVQCIQPLYKL